MYDPVLGRFMQPDPIGYYDSLNLYTYCGNNPINWNDPYGLCKSSLLELIRKQEKSNTAKVLADIDHLEKRQRIKVFGIGFNMKTLIIIDENGDTSIFDSAESAARDLEPIDVTNNEFVGYDSEGYLLSLSVEGSDSVPMYKRVIKISKAEEFPTHAHVIKELLKKYLMDIGVPDESIAVATLEQLVNEARKYAIS